MPFAKKIRTTYTAKIVFERQIEYPEWERVCFKLHIIFKTY
jgi:hypothetical protein